MTVIATICVVLVFLVSLVVAPPPVYPGPQSPAPTRTQETNSNRLRRGLPPLKPARMYDPTKRGSALTPRTSTVLANRGYIALYTTGNTPYCYLTNLVVSPLGKTTDGLLNGNNGNTLSCTTDPNNPAIQLFSFPTTSPPVSISVVGTADWLQLYDSTGPEAAFGIDNNQTAAGSDGSEQTTVFTIGSDGSITASVVVFPGFAPPTYFSVTTDETHGVYAQDITTATDLPSGLVQAFLYFVTTMT